jgi:hypothetical protein
MYLVLASFINVILFLVKKSASNIIPRLRNESEDQKGRRQKVTGITF